jgi:hypothetical protein
MLLQTQKPALSKNAAYCCAKCVLRSFVSIKFYRSTSNSAECQSPSVLLFRLRVCSKRNSVSCNRCSIKTCAITKGICCGPTAGSWRSRATLGGLLKCDSQCSRRDARWGQSNRQHKEKWNKGLSIHQRRWSRHDPRRGSESFCTIFHDEERWNRPRPRTYPANRQ